MDHGRILQVGHPDQVYADPASPFVYDFIGHSNRFEGRVKDGKLCLGGVTLGSVPAGISDGKVAVYVRPHDIALASPGASDSLPAKILQRLPAGSVHRLEAESPASQQTVEIELPLSVALPPDLEPGSTIGLWLTAYKLFPA
jgi:sulfate transport system ATP-binding protein